MTEVALLARAVLAVVFAVSAVAKLRDRAGTRQATEDFGVPPSLVPAVSSILPFAELACAVLLVCADPGATVGAVAALLLLGAFTVTIATNLLRGNAVDCHCFGQLGAGPAGWRSVARNAVLMLLAALPLARVGQLSSLPTALDDYTGQQLGVTAALALLTAAVAALALFCQTLMARYGGVLLRLEALETVVGLAPAKPAPAFSLPDLEGDVVDLPTVLAAGKPALIAFVSPSCAMCSELLPDLQRWQADEAHPVSVVVISSGTVEANRAKIGADSPLQVLLQDGLTTELAYGVEGTPGACLVGVDGTFLAPTMYGVDPIRSGHANVLANLGGHDHELHQIQPRPVAIGDDLTELEVQTDAGKSVALTDLTADEQILLFWRFDCGYCAQIADDVMRLEAEAPLLVVTGSGTQDIRDSGLQSPIVREDVGQLSAALQVPGTPSAVTIRGGVVTSSVMVGGPDVLGLIERSRRPAEAVS